jgi:hypothetical protein
LVRQPIGRRKGTGAATKRTRDIGENDREEADHLRDDAQSPASPRLQEHEDRAGSQEDECIESTPSRM